MKKVDYRAFAAALTTFGVSGDAYSLAPGRDGTASLVLLRHPEVTNVECMTLAEFEQVGVEISDTDWIVTRQNADGTLTKGLLAYFKTGGTWRYFWGTNRDQKILTTFAGISEIEVILHLSRLIILGEV